MIKKILSNKLLIFVLSYLSFLIAIAIFYPIFSSVDPTEFNPNQILIPQPPSGINFFGTDELNRDIFSRIIIGSRISLMVGLIAVSISSSLGTIVGLISGYFGGVIDEILMRLVDIMIAIPSIFLILTLQIILEPRIETVMIVIGLTGWMGVSRLVRAEVLKIKELPFVTAAKSRGLSEFNILIRYIFPQTIQPILVASTLGLGYAILTEAVLSFLGLGVQPPHPSWGNMLQNSLAYLSEAPWMSIFPGIFITMTVLSFNILGDAMQKYMIKQNYANA
mgnify:CR=1 FL=1